MREKVVGQRRIEKQYEGVSLATTCDQEQSIALNWEILISQEDYCTVFMKQLVHRKIIQQIGRETDTFTDSHSQTVIGSFYMALNPLDFRTVTHGHGSGPTTLRISGIIRKC